ncbi:Uncharacterised protein [Dermatophilus congolensis]|uniref:DUF5926 domain-containing protein n=1 Tax=Dermatophilus congolensis TaxID=1863 RepID=A0A239V577_9MICO|nr:DUF5926 family protein [Dermatophilus congolensis]SNV17367.1 Uncharacterised protein [Dermatophilus congolensis]
MGKAARRARKEAQAARTTVAAAPFIARPFEGLSGESDWVAMRQLLPAALATITLRDCDPIRSALGHDPSETDLNITITTLLPGAWPALHRDNGERLIAIQSVGASGDASRDIAAAILAALAAPAGAPVTHMPPVNADTPRLQDLIDPATTFAADLRAGFDYWVPDVNALDARAKAELEEANASLVPTTRMPADACPKNAIAYWGLMGDRALIRLILTDEENRATDALARLHAASADTLQAEQGAPTRLLGAFRADGVLIPVWDLDPALGAEAYEKALAEFSTRYTAALASDAPLNPEERRARSGLLSRQLTLR